MFKPIREPLPADSLLFLTQVLTWAVDGKARDDREFDLHRRELARRNAAEWDDADGPEWLVPILEEMAKGKQIQPPGVDARARSWMSQHGLTPDAVLAKAHESLRASAERADRQRTFLRLLFHGCRKGHHSLYGLEVSERGSRAHVDYKEIPRSFFMRSPHFSPGKGQLGHGELTSVPRSDKELLESVFNRSAEADRSPTYVGIKMDREEAEILVRFFDEEVRQLKREEIFELVRSCRLTPAEGEAEAARLGLSPLNPRLNAAEYDASKLNDWTFAMAGAWIAWRDLDRVRDQWVEWRSKHHSWRQVSCPGDLDPATGQAKVWCALVPTWNHHEGSWQDLALDIVDRGTASQSSVLGFGETETQLWSALKSGELEATGVNPSTGKRVVIPAIEFMDLTIYCRDREEDRLTYDQLVYMRPRLDSRAVMKMWPGRASKVTAASESKCRKRLVEEMRASPKGTDKSKLAWYRQLAKEFEGLGDPEQKEPSESFNRAWKDAMGETGAAWDRPGRKRPGKQDPGGK